MAFFLKPKKNNTNTDNIFWTTMADLMLGLCIIFITLFVLAITGFTSQDMQVKKQQIEVSKELIEKLNQENIKVDVDKMTGDLKISDLDLFEVNSYTLSNKGKLYLDKLIPIYLDTIFSNKNISENIENIVIQGHTDSQMFAGISSKEKQFLRNMQLSLLRANSVADYVFQTNYDKKYKDQLIKIIIVEGKSFTEPVLVDGKEDFARSRRVELRLKLKKWDIMDAIGQAGGFNSKKPSINKKGVKNGKVAE